MTIYMKEGIAAHVNGILRTYDQFDPYTGEKPVMIADLGQANGMIYIFQQEEDGSQVTRMVINKDNVLYIDFENEDEAKRRPLVTVRKME